MTIKIIANNKEDVLNILSQHIKYCQYNVIDIKEL